MSTSAIFALVMFLLVISSGHAGADPLVPSKTSRHDESINLGRSSSSNLMVKVYTEVDFKGHSELFALGHNYCVNLGQTQKFDKKINSIKIKTNTTSGQIPNSKCALFFNTDNCTKGLVHLANVGTEISDLKILNMTAINSPAVVGSVKACPEGFTSIEILSPGFPAILRMNFTNSSFTANSSRINSTFLVKPDRCMAFPSFPNTTKYTLHLESTNDHAKKDKKNISENACVEVYTKLNCSGTSLQLSKEKKNKSPANISIVSTSLCNFKARRDLNFPIISSKAAHNNPIIPNSTSSKIVSTTTSTTTTMTTTTPTPAAAASPMGWILYQQQPVVGPIPQIPTIASTTMTTPKATSTITTTSTALVVYVPFPVYYPTGPVVPINNGNSTQKSNITTSFNVTTNSTMTTLRPVQKATLKSSKKNSTKNATKTTTTTPRPAKVKIVLNTYIKSGSSSMNIFFGWFDKNPYVGLALCLFFIAAACDYCCACCQMRQNTYNIIV